MDPEEDGHEHLLCLSASTCGVSQKKRTHRVEDLRVGREHIPPPDCLRKTNPCTLRHKRYVRTPVTTTTSDTLCLTDVPIPETSKEILFLSAAQVPRPTGGRVTDESTLYHCTSRSDRQTFFARLTGVCTLFGPLS